ncbi:MAG: ribosome-associated translation inhibitor RaiA [Oscillospiraceae bacterium]|jgi:putative sigma-54 modulation protein|nr:ribosome-associated translation inhibitor RaiA [Oscillospiraceae bacterium]
MRFHYLGKHVNVSDKLKEFAEKKVGKLEKFFRHESDVQITVAGEGNRQTIEITVSHDGMFFRARETGDDRFAMIDKAVAAIERQIRKNKTRLEKSLHQGMFEREAGFSADDISEEQNFEIRRVKRFALKPMTAEEAILQMNLLHHEFFVFRNIEGNVFAVVYKRDDGGYGLIEEG